jgi:hypothetical protein
MIATEDIDYGVMCIKVHKSKNKVDEVQEDIPFG